MWIIVETERKGKKRRRAQPRGCLCPPLSKGNSQQRRTSTSCVEMSSCSNYVLTKFRSLLIS